VAGARAKVTTTVGVGDEMAAVQAIAVEVDESAATRALASPLPEVEAEAAHSPKVGAA